MWNVKGHEAARLPMIYAAAWDATGKQEYFELYRKYLEPAVKQSFDVEGWQPTYALLQMQTSFELLESLETDPKLKDKMRAIMAMVSDRCAARAASADQVASALDLTAVCGDWRTSEGIRSTGQYRKVWYNIRESGEAALAQLIDTKERLPLDQQTFLKRAITRLNYDKVSSCGIFDLQAAYWKARRHGLYAVK
jgi:hypothetical protein